MATPAAFARMAARPVDRVHIAASTAPTLEELLAIDGYAVSPGHAAAVVSILAHDGMTWDELRLPLRYAPEDRVRERLDFCVEHGVITFDDNRIAYTPEGRLAAGATLDARAVALEEKWANAPQAVSELIQLLTPVANLARRAGKPGCKVHDAALTTPNRTLGSELWLLLANVRRFRADCHGEAWAEAGHTAESIVALGMDEPQRVPIERRTDELNAEIWVALSHDDQLHCMAALACLDGSGTPT